MFDKGNYSECIDILSELQIKGFDNASEKKINDIVAEIYYAGYGEQALDFATKFHLPIETALRYALNGYLSHAVQYGLHIIAIPDGTNLIKDGEFSDLSNLEKIKIPSSVTSIGSVAFQGCTSLTSIEIPSSVTCIEAALFQGCSSLTSVVIPNSLKSVGSFAFDGCPNLKNVYYIGTSSDWDNIKVIGGKNTDLTNATRYYYSETAPTESGNFWRYVDGVPTPW